MKKNIALLLLISLGIFSMVGCLKDNGFENNEYGIKDPNGTPKGLGFPLGVNPSNLIGLEAVASNNQSVKDIVVVSLFDGDLPERDVKVNIVVDNSLVDAYNTANGTDIRVFKPQFYNLPSLVVTVPAGQRLGQLPINIPTTVPLNLDSTYGIGLRIVSNDGGYLIPARTQTLVVFFNLKNKYDGVYRVTGTFVDFTNATFTGRYPLEYHLVTTGPSSVDVRLNNINGEIIPGYLFNAGTAGSFFGSFGLTMTFNPATDLVSDLHNYYGDPLKSATAVGTPSTGTGAPFYISSNTRRAVLDPSGVNAFNPSTHNVRIKYFMIQTNAPSGNSPRAAFDETWTYIGPRP